MYKPCLQILHVEDNPAEVLLVHQAFDEANIEYKIEVVSNGEDALRYLRKEGAFITVNRPDLVLLDLNLPKKNGFEVLQVVKNDPSLKSIPVMVFTGSESNSDKHDAFKFQADGYFKKPGSFPEYLQMVQYVLDFWTKKSPA